MKPPNKIGDEQHIRVLEQARANALANAIRNAIPVLEQAGYTIIPPHTDQTPELA